MALDVSTTTTTTTAAAATEDKTSSVLTQEQRAIEPKSQSIDERLQGLEERLGRAKFLEDRVQELETKLSVLSRLLKLQNNKNGTTPLSLTPEKKALLTVMPSPAGAESFKGPSQKQRQGGGEQENVPPRPTTPPLVDLGEAACSSSTTSTPASASAVIMNTTTTTSAETSSSPPQTPRTERRDTAHNIPHLESPASFIGKDRESARLSWRKETQTAPAFPILDVNSQQQQRQQQHDEQQRPQQPTTSTTTLPIFEGVPATSHSIYDAPLRATDTTLSANASSFRLPESAVAPKNGNCNERLSHSKRNLSFRLLYEGDEKAYKQGKLANSAPPAQTSMTLAERRWIGSLAQSISGERQQVVTDANVRNKWLNYLNSFQEESSDVDVQMQEFIKVPGQVEGIMGFGFYICVDSFLYCITVLPIRFVWSCLLLLNRFLLKRSGAAFTFHRRHSYQIIQVFILYCVHAYVLAPISIGQLYHWIRGQAMIKLYVLIAIVEVFDRLMCSMGQDCLDSMYWNTVNRPTSTRMLISVAVVLVYCTIHTLLLFVHVATLNVAMNSADQALLALLISGNFAEIKSTVFKKYNRPALFKLTASDICERFKLGLFLGLVLLLNYCQGMERGQFFQFLRTCGLIWGGELLADWIKHSFITKFNFLPARVFKEYALLLAGDVTGIGHEGVNVDHSHAVVKRIGFAQLPFVSVSFRLVMEAAKYGALNEYWQSLSTATVYGIFAASWMALLIVKLALGSLLHQHSLYKLRAAPEMKLTPKRKKKQ